MTGEPVAGAATLAVVGGSIALMVPVVVGLALGASRLRPPRDDLCIGEHRATIEHMFSSVSIGQRSLFGSLDPAYDASFAELTRLDLDETTWVDHAAGWLVGADGLFDELTAELPFRQRTGIQMYDQVVDEPRLSAWWSVASGQPEPMPILREIRLLLADRYREPFDSIGFNLYRDGNDSVAWHGDRHRHVVTNPVIAILSVGAPRPFKLRPRGGGNSLSWPLGHGDLFVMGGACQHDWEHTVPKVRGAVGARLSITFRSV